VSRLARSGAFFAVLLIAAACAGAPATSGPTATPAGATNQPTSGATATAAPTTGQTVPPVTGNECANFPTFNLASPAFPSFAPDPALEARFPTEIDGQPVRDLESFSWAAIACMGGQAAVDAVRGTAEFDLLALTMATAEATVDGEDVSLTAFRIAGGDANKIVQVLAQIAASAGDDNDIVSINPGSAGGKSVIVVTHDDGTTSFGYVSGDTLFLADDITQSQADKIFGALS
jgi:hypothetical protein